MVAVKKARVLLSTGDPNGLVPLFEVPTNLPVERIKTLIHNETGLEPNKQHLLFNGKEIQTSKQTLSTYGVGDADNVIVSSSPTSNNTTTTPNSTNNNAINSNTMSPSNEMLIDSESPEFNPEAQRRMWEYLRFQNVQKNMEEALEHNPEAFGSVVMLYVDAEINGKPVKAFVDSGAQTTIMSVKCAERCGLLHLLDPRFGGIAKGVGTARILGRIHLASIRIGNAYLDCTLTVLDSNDMEFLLGLDMLKKFQAVIDLKDNVLRLGSNVVVPFLAEKDLYEDIPKAFGFQ